MAPTFVQICKAKYEDLQKVAEAQAEREVRKAYSFRTADKLTLENIFASALDSDKSSTSTEETAD
jgi:hypothetical protein